MKQIKECPNRPKGMDVKTWCAQNNLTNTNYYYRLWHVRKVCLEQFSDAEALFCRTTVPEKPAECSGHTSEFHFSEKAVPVIHMKNSSGLCVKVLSDISPALLPYVIKTLNQAE